MQQTHALLYLALAHSFNNQHITNPPWLPLLVISIANCFPRTEPRDATLGRTGDPCVLLNVFNQGTVCRLSPPDR